MTVSYVCAEIVTPENVTTATAYPVCKTWAVQPAGVLDSLALTKSEAQMVGGSILGFYVVLVLGAMMAKGINSL